MQVIRPRHKRPDTAPLGLHRTVDKDCRLRAPVMVLYDSKRRGYTRARYQWIGIRPRIYEEDAPLVARA